MNKQVNKGKGNINITAPITITINVNGKAENVDVDALFILGKVAQVFSSEDKFINDSIPGKIIVNKTNDKEEFKTSKIITSLLQLGIPLSAAYEIAQLTIYRIKEFITTYRNTENILTTKDIRKMVSESIQEISVDRFPYEDIENWNNKYIRRYGHNNKRIQIYYNNTETTNDISYDFIHNTLIDDIIDDITKGKKEYVRIPSKHKNELATEILSFINSCDLYRINYTVLKDIVKEIALQPPHPWFINQETQQQIMKYDYECLENNISKLEKSISETIDSPQSVKIEVLHHASALILEKYEHFLGCYDLSSFYLLKHLLDELIEPENWDLSVKHSKASKLLADMSFAHIDIIDFINTMDLINSQIKSHKIYNEKFDELLIEFARKAIRLYKLGKTNQVMSFLNSSWNDIDFSAVIKNLKLILYSLFPTKNWNIDNPSKHFFWVNYNSVLSTTYPNIKNQMLVVYGDKDLTDYTFLNMLSNAKAINACNTIFAISEKKEDAKNICDHVEKFLYDHCLADRFIVFWFDKESFMKLSSSKNKMKYLDNQMGHQMTLED